MRASHHIRVTRKLRKTKTVETVPEKKPKRNDRDLVRCYLEGDEVAFGELYRRYKNAVYGFLCGATGDPSISEDLAEETWTAFLTAAGRFRGECGLRHYLLRIASHKVTDWRRAQGDTKRFVRFDEDSPTPIVVLSTTPEEMTERKQGLARFWSLIAGLPVEQREVVILHYGFDCTLEEIGNIVDVGRETVKSRLRYAVNKLRKRLMPGGDDVPGVELGVVQ